MRRRLSIYVPTYHRTQELQKCLESVILECNRNKEQNIAIYVSNNDSSDLLTFEMVEKLKNSYSNIYYSSNDENIGIDGNMQLGFEWPDSQYCLMLGDDDEICKGGLKIIFDIIDNYDNLAFAILNWISEDDNGTKNLAWSICQNILYENVVECFRENYDATPYGTILCNLEYASEVSSEKRRKYMGTFHLYTGILWEMVLKNGIIVKSAEPIILKRSYCKKSWDSERADVMLVGIPKWFDTLPEVYQKYARGFKRIHVDKIKNTRIIMGLLRGYKITQWKTFRGAHINWSIKAKVFIILIVYSLIPYAFFAKVNSIINNER